MGTRSPTLGRQMGTKHSAERREPDSEHGGKKGTGSQNSAERREPGSEHSAEIWEPGS